MSETNLVEVKPVVEFDEGDREFVSVDGVEVGVLNVKGDFYALQNRCQHDSGPVCSGKVHRKLVGNFTGAGKRIEKKYSDERIISCPWHGWSYDLESGDHIGSDEITLPTYEVVIKDNTVCVGSRLD